MSLSERDLLARAFIRDHIKSSGLPIGATPKDCASLAADVIRAAYIFAETFQAEAQARASTTPDKPFGVGDGVRLWGTSKSGYVVGMTANDHPVIDWEDGSPPSPYFPEALTRR